MKKLTAVLAILLALVIPLSLASCGKKEQDKKDETEAAQPSALVGTWESTDAAGTYYTFNEDGSGSLDGEGYSLAFNYTDKDGVLAITYLGAATSQNANYTVEDDILTLKSDLVDGVSTYKKAEKKQSDATENNADNGSKLVGSWESAEDGSVYTFNANGTGSVSVKAATVNFTYTDDGSVIELTFTNVAPKKASYTLEGDTLKMTDEDQVTLTFTKKQ